MVRRHSFAYSRKSLFDVENAIIIGAEATIAIRQAEVLAAKRMIERSMEPLWALSGRLMGDSAFESAEMLARLVHEHGIEPHIPAFDKSRRQEGTFRRSDFVYDRKVDVYICPAGKLLKQSLAVKVKSPVVEAPQ